MQRLKDDDVEIHTRSAFLQGLLLMSQADMPEKFSAWSGLWHTWHQWLLEKKVSAVQACLAFPLSFPEIDRVVVGADSVSHLAQIVSAANKLLQAGLPDIHCNDENLINPAKWNEL
jgi:aryl-alcohol dehydrogenase-like predicted oxidoreductase